MSSGVAGAAADCSAAGGTDRRACAVAHLRAFTATGHRAEAVTDHRAVAFRRAGCKQLQLRLLCPLQAGNPAFSLASMSFLHHSWPMLFSVAFSFVFPLNMAQCTENVSLF